MRILSFSLKIMLLLVAPVLMMTSCKDDEPTPDTAKIHGTITLENAELWDTWKDSDEVQLTIFPEFSLNPPAGWGAVPADFLYPGFPGGTFALGAPYNSQNPLVINYQPGTTSIDYEISNIDPGTYSALAIGLRHNTITDPSLRTATLGVHWGNPNTTSHGIVIKVDVGGGQIVTVFDEPAPSTITLAKGDNKEINFKADFSILPLWFQ